MEGSIAKIKTKTVCSATPITVIAGSTHDAISSFCTPVGLTNRNAKHVLSILLAFFARGAWADRHVAATQVDLNP